MSDLEQELSALRTAAEQSLQSADSADALKEWHRTYLSRTGALTTALRRLKEVPADRRAEVGRVANELKTILETAFHARETAVEQEADRAGSVDVNVDVTLPGRPLPIGHLHPSTAAIQEIYRIFHGLGFSAYEAPEVETDRINFELLNMPAGHPARDMWDTFYTTTPGLVLRTHTSSFQMHAMWQTAPAPVRVVSAGKCFRYEEVTARSEFMFHQLEGVAVGPGITFADLKSVLLEFANQFFGPGQKMRFRKSYFPFTEPSVEVDVACTLCKGAGCHLCKQTGWLEVLGAGMVHPTVLKNGGYDPTKVSGFAFGMGPERLTMLKYQIDDIRYFFSNDVRFAERFP